MASRDARSVLSRCVVKMFFVFFLNIFLFHFINILIKCKALDRNQFEKTSLIGVCSIYQTRFMR